MSLGLMYYLLTIVGGLSLIFGILAFTAMVFTVIITIAFMLHYFDSDRNAKEEKTYERIKLVAPKAIKVTAVLLAIRILVPSKTDLAIIAGLNVTETTVKQIANSDTAAKALELINQELDARLEANRKANEGKK
nr:MAG TPA: hypothetical protein [Caudoviricetes sp.]DAX53370.1 MAG TPA: hypothetical protein [Caudoviricetes sp.]